MDNIFEVVNSLPEVAQFFDRSERTIRRWAAAGMPRLANGKYNLSDIAAWLEKRGDSPGNAGPLFPGGKAHDERLKKAKADLAEMEVNQRRGELIQRDEFIQMFVQRILAVKNGLLTLQRSLPPQLINCTAEREMEGIIKNSVLELLKNFASPPPKEYQSEILSKAIEIILDAGRPGDGR